MIAIAKLREADRDAWETLARGYKAFYETEIPDERYEETWRLLIADERVHGLVARLDGRIVGIAHYLFHAQTWSADTCYLQDLFTAEEARSKGAGRALIEAVYARAKEAGASRVYWLTHETNETARALYDKLADRPGFIQYRKLF